MNVNSLLGKMRRNLLLQPVVRPKPIARLRVESLEDRAVPAFLPTPVIDETVKVSLGAGQAPTMIMDPLDTNRLVMAYATATSIEINYSTDAGNSWATVTAAFTDPNIPYNVSVDPTSPEGQNPPLRYTQLKAPTVAFDRFHNFFVAHTQTNADPNISGRVVVSKFEFAGGDPNFLFQTEIHEWKGEVGSPEYSAYLPYVAIDTSESTFQDPDVAGAAGLQTNTHAALQTTEDTVKVYVAWASDTMRWNVDTQAEEPAQGIEMVVSADGGLSFSNPMKVNDAGYGANNVARPHIAFTQGRAGDAASGGKMVVVFGNGGTITSDVSDPAVIAHFTHSGNGGGIFDRPSGDPAPPPATTVFTESISAGEIPANFTQIDDLNLTLALVYHDLKELEIELVAPTGESVRLIDYGYNIGDGSEIFLGPGQTNPRGIPGTTLGVNNWNPDTGYGRVVGTTFDDEAARNIRNQGAVNPYIGRFRPVQFSMSNFDGLTVSDITSGDWELRITDVKNGGDGGGLIFWDLNFASGLNDGGLGFDSGTGALSVAQTANPAGSPRAGFSIAVDNTLGAFSPYQNRVYVAYSDIFNGGDVRVAYGDVYDDGFAVDAHWVGDYLVNDDVDDFGNPRDNFSEGNRAQYNPTVAVDQSTGTLALTYYDNRYDPANLRGVTMFTTSITGPEFGTDFPVAQMEFAKSAILNHMEQAFDQITSRTIDLEPVPTNFTASAAPNLGENSGLSVFGGRVNSVWSGNLNSAGFELRTQALTIAAGPRGFRGDMGPIIADGLDVSSGITYNDTFAVGADGRRQFTGFVIQFDRPIDPSTFTVADVQVLFRGPLDNPIGPGTNVLVTGITELNPNQFGTSRFLVSVAPQTKTGTYSYTIGSDVSDRIRLGTTSAAIITPSGPAQVFSASGPEVPQPINDFTTITSDINVPVGAFLPGEVVSNVSVTLNITHTFDSDLNIVLIAPNGSRLTLSQYNGGSRNGMNLTFIDSAVFSITSAPTNNGPALTGQWRPEQAFTNLDGSALDGIWSLEVSDDAGADFGSLDSWSIQLTPGVLVGGGTVITQYGNLMDQDGDTIEGEATDDQMAVPNPVNGVPFILPYATDSLPLSLPGTHIVRTLAQNEVAGPSNLDHVVKDKTVKFIDIEFDRKVSSPTFTATDVLHVIGPFGRIVGTAAEPIRVAPINFLGAAAENLALSTSKYFRVYFPTQKFNGSYRIQLGPNILDSDLNKLDSNVNAGVDNLTGRTSGGIASTVEPTTGDVDIQLLAGKTTVVPITVSDAFLLQKVTTRIHILHPDVRQLEARLISPDGSSVLLFRYNIGFNGSNHANLINTTFDDSAPNPIQAGTAPFENAAFNPMQPLAQLIGHPAAGQWKLSITNIGTDNGSLKLFELDLGKIAPGDGLGEVTADQASTSFRIYNSDPTNTQSRTNWLPVGPSEVLTYDNAGNIIDRSTAGRIGAIAVDPTDLSGNTVFTAGASGGVWKTTNFLTHDAAGPTWIQLTDFGPTTGINIGALAVYNTTQDATKSIVIAGTGEESSMNLADPYHYDTVGVGFLISLDGGLTWRVLDSTVNNAAGLNGAPLPVTSPLRDHIFIDGVVNKIVFDPGVDPITNLPVMYAAVGAGNANQGATGPAGLWRSDNLGATWTRVMTGSNGAPIADISDFVLSNSSGDVANGQPQVLFAGVPGFGVYRSVNRGGSWSLMTAGIGNALIRDDTPNGVTVNPPAGDPNGNTNKGRIALATPGLSKSDFSDKYFGGWLYAAVSTTNGDFDGLYMTRDFGDNWTKVRLASSNYTIPTADDGLLFTFAPAIPTNNELGNQVPVAGGGTVFVPNVDVEPLVGNGNEALTLVVDPNDPNIVYLGSDNLIRVDTTKINDPRNMTVYTHSDMDGGLIRRLTTGAATIEIREGVIGYTDPGLLGLDSIGRDRTTPFTGLYSLELPGDTAQFPPRRVWNYLNLFRDPDQPFPGATGSTLFSTNLANFTNTGEDASWQHVMTHRSGADPSVGEFDDWGDLVTINRMVSTIDPITGKARIIYGDDEGIHTFVSEGDNRLFAELNNGIGFAAPIDGARNGNLQIAQYRSGAVQPSLLAADIAKVLFYGAAHYNEDPGAGSSTQLNDGNLLYKSDAYGTPATWVETDATGSGTVYQLRTTALTSIPTDFFQVTLPGQTAVGRTFGLFEAGDNPELNQGQWRYGLTKFAVNPIDKNGIAMGSLAGNVFLTTGQGISGVGQWFKIGTAAQLDGSYAEALAFGSPQNSGGGALNNHLYAGTRAGHVFVTLNGGGVWTNITGGAFGTPGALDGSPIQKVIADPGRGSRELYVVTEQGVYHMVDAGAATPVWDNITSNLGSITNRAFNNPNWELPMAQVLNTMAVDWRFKYDKNPRAPRLYVGGDAGVFRSLDGGTTWSRYPVASGTTVDGGGLPVVRVVDLDLAIGNIQQTTGLPNATASPDMLVATTMGRGMWSIRLESPTISGPGVNAQSLNNPIITPGGTVSQIELTFDTAINPDTFTEDDIRSIITPGGTITDRAQINALVDVLDITFPPPGQANRHDKWRIVFNTPFAADGTYKIVIGPDINDWAGRPMDQNNNNVNGEATADQYNATFIIANNDLGDFARDSYAKLLTQPGGPTRAVTNTEYLAKGVQDIETARFTALGVIVKELLSVYNVNPLLNGTYGEARLKLVARLFANGNAVGEIGHLLPGYEALIGTPAFNSEVNNLVLALKNGTKSPESIVGDILLKPQYYASAGSTPIGFLTKVYADLFKGSGLQFSWLPQATQNTQLTQAASATGRSKLVRGLVGQTAVKFYQGGDISTPLQTTYYRNHLVTLAYQLYLGRVATAAEITAGKAQINRLLAKNSLAGSEWLLWKIFSTKEYFGTNTQTETPALPDNGLHTNRSWVDEVIKDRYFRAADDDGDGLLSRFAERESFSQKVLDRYMTQRTSFLKGAAGIVGLTASTEFRTIEIKKYFQLVHGATRVVSDSEMQSALSALGAGSTFQTLIAGQLGTVEFYEAAPELVGEFVTSKNTWARAVFKRLFNQNLLANDPKVIALANKAGTTATTRTAAAKLVLIGTAATNPNGTEFRDKQIVDAFQLLLGRAPTTVGVGNERDKYQTFLKTKRWEHMLVELMILREFWEIKN